MAGRIDNIPPEKRGNPAWVKGAQSPNPGGRPKKLTLIEKMLDEEFRGVDHMREVYTRLRALALGELVTVVGKDGEVTVELQADPAFMKMLLERLQGPVTAPPIDLTDVPEEELRVLREKLRQ